jgi:hypothetical protein
MLTVHKLRLFSARVEYTVVLDQLDTVTSDCGFTLAGSITRVKSSFL